MTGDYSRDGDVLIQLFPAERVAVDLHFHLCQEIVWSVLEPSKSAGRKGEYPLVGKLQEHSAVFDPSASCQRLNVNGCGIHRIFQSGIPCAHAPIAQWQSTDGRECPDSTPRPLVLARTCTHSPHSEHEYGAAPLLRPSRSGIDTRLFEGLLACRVRKVCTWHFAIHSTCGDNAPEEVFYSVNPTLATAPSKDSSVSGCRPLQCSRHTPLCRPPGKAVCTWKRKSPSKKGR